MGEAVENIDDLLLNQGKAPESESEPDESAAEEPEEQYGEEVAGDDESAPAQPKPEPSNDEEEPQEGEQKEAAQYDEYGNEKPKPRTYTEDEVNEMFRKRFKGQAAPPTPMQSEQAQQAAKDFAYDESSDKSWQEQLEGFVEQTFNKITQKQVAQHQYQIEQSAQAEFQEKFTQGMSRFNDFQDVVEAQPISQAMALSLRGINDPSAFIYAASKRNPQELERISKITDPYRQMVEMGRLEERMRKRPATTSAPKPVSRTQDDGKYAGTKPTPPKNGESIDDMLVQADAQRMKRLRQARAR